MQDSTVIEMVVKMVLYHMWTLLVTWWYGKVMCLHITECICACRSLEQDTSARNLINAYKFAAEVIQGQRGAK